MSHPYTFNLGSTTAKVGLTDSAGGVAPLSAVKIWKMSLEKQLA